MSQTYTRTKQRLTLSHSYFVLLFVPFLLLYIYFWTELLKSFVHKRVKCLSFCYHYKFFFCHKALKMFELVCLGCISQPSGGTR